MARYARLDDGLSASETGVVFTDFWVTFWPLFRLLFCSFWSVFGLAVCSRVTGKFVFGPRYFYRFVFWWRKVVRA
jgi:hypothetical protein